MSQRLARQRQRLVGAVISSSPIGSYSDGSPIFQICGAEEESGGSGSGGSSGGTNDPAGGGAGEGGQGDDDEEVKNPRLLELSRENAAKRTALRKAVQERDAALEKVKEFESANKSELERTQGERDDAVTRSKELESRVQTLGIENAFLRLSPKKFAWIDPEAAFLLLDRTGIEIDKEGKVSGMEEAAKKLAKDRPYLVDKPGQGQQGPASGQHPNGGGGTGNQQPDRAALSRTYGALGGRV